MSNVSAVQQAVRNALKSVGVSEFCADAYFKRAIASEVNDPRQQLIQFNRFLRNELGGLRANTLDARSCLVDSLSVADWEYCLGKYIAPILRRYGIV